MLLILCERRCIRFNGDFVGWSLSLLCFKTGSQLFKDALIFLALFKIVQQCKDMSKTEIKISQNVAILVDGNNIERSLHEVYKKKNAMLNFDTLIPRLIEGRGLNRLIYFREGKNISSKLAERLHENFYGAVRPCHKSADIPLSIKATQLASKVDTIIIMSGDSDYIETLRHLKAEGVRIEICAVKETTAGILIEECDYFHPITKDDCFVYKKPSGR